MRPKGTAAELEVRRRLAGQLLRQGKGVREVARLVQVTPSAVSHWKRALDQQGMEALKSKAHPGRAPRLSDAQKRKLLEVLARGAIKSGYTTNLWSCSRVAAVIERRFGVKYHPSHVWKLLRRLGWSAQKPELRARERNEAAIRDWRDHDWPRIKKGARKTS